MGSAMKAETRTTHVREYNWDDQFRRDGITSAHRSEAMAMVNGNLVNKYPLDTATPTCLSDDGSMVYLRSLDIDAALDDTETLKQIYGRIRSNLDSQIESGQLRRAGYCIADLRMLEYIRDIAL